MLGTQPGELDDIGGRQVATGKAPRGRMTRRALLVAGGVTLLAAYARDPVQRITDAATNGAAHPAPPPGRMPAASPPVTSAATHAARPTQSVTSPPARARLDRARTRAAGHGQLGDLPVMHVDDGPKGIALTIDDGPSPVYTPQVLQLLDRYQVTATFSMIGLEVDAYPAMAREVVAAGHTIANHTWSHQNLAWMAPPGIVGQINRASDAIRRATGQEPTLFRAPYGAWSPAVLRYCTQTAMTPLDWSVDPRDWSRPGVASIVSNIMRNTRAGSIILEHDGGGNRAQTVAALKIVLPRLLDAGYHFTTP